MTSTTPPPAPPSPPDTLLAGALREWLPGRRWYGGGGGADEAAAMGPPPRILRRDALGGGLEIVLVGAHTGIGMAGGIGDPVADVRLVPLFHSRTAVAAPLSPVLPYTVDALEDPAGLVAFARRFAGVEAIAGRPLGLDQSNSSVILTPSAPGAGELLLKVYRRLHPGPHPDIELHAALTAAHSPAIAPLRGHIEIELPGMAGGRATAGLIQDYITDAMDGWLLALEAVRAHVAGTPTRAGGGVDPRAIGAAVAGVHRDLAGALGCAPGPDGASAATAMSARLDSAARVVPALAPHVAGARAVFSTLADLDPYTVQRIHGDLHLGQVLRSPRGWLLVDFEGEPAAAPATRRAADTPLRDIAGMLRSFDYAAHVGARAAAGGSPAAAAPARTWAALARDEFCAGYTAVSGTDPRSCAPLLRAIELDKAIYEAVYEAAHRPGWVAVPLAAVARLTAGA